MEITYECLTSDECTCLIPATKSSSAEQILCLWAATIDEHFKEKNKHYCMLRENRKEEGKLVLFPCKLHINFKAFSAGLFLEDVQTGIHFASGYVC